MVDRSIILPAGSVSDRVSDQHWVQYRIQIKQAQQHHRKAPLTDTYTARDNRLGIGTTGLRVLFDLNFLTYVFGDFGHTIPMTTEAVYKGL